MADGLCRMAGSGCGFFIDGATWYLKPLTLRDWGEIEQFLLFRRPTNPIREMTRVVQRLPQDLASKLISDIQYDLRKDKRMRVVTFDEVMEWVASDPEGIAYTAWQCFRDNPNPNLHTLEGVTKALVDLPHGGLLEFIRLRDQVSGTDLLASADWPSPLDGVRPERRARRMEQIKKTYHSWRRNWYVLAGNYQFTHGDVADMTLYQYKVYTSKEEDLGIKTEEGR